MMQSGKSKLISGIYIQFNTKKIKVDQSQRPYAKEVILTYMTATEKAPKFMKDRRGVLLEYKLRKLIKYVKELSSEVKFFSRKTRRL